MKESAIEKLKGYITMCRKDYRQGRYEYDVLSVEGMMMDLLDDLEEENIND